MESPQASSSLLYHPLSVFIHTESASLSLVGFFLACRQPARSIGKRPKGSGKSVSDSFHGCVSLWLVKSSSPYICRVTTHRRPPPPPSLIVEDRLESAKWDHTTRQTNTHTRTHTPNGSSSKELVLQAFFSLSFPVEKHFTPTKSRIPPPPAFLR